MECLYRSWGFPKPHLAIYANADRASLAPPRAGLLQGEFRQLVTAAEGSANNVRIVTRPEDKGRFELGAFVDSAPRISSFGWFQSVSFPCVNLINHHQEFCESF